MHSTLCAVCESGVQVSDLPRAVQPSGSLLDVTRPVSDASFCRVESFCPLLKLFLV